MTGLWVGDDDAVGAPGEQAILDHRGVMELVDEEEADDEEKEGDRHGCQAGGLPVGILVSVSGPACVVEPNHEITMGSLALLDKA